MVTTSFQFYPRSTDVDDVGDAVELEVAFNSIQDQRGLISMDMEEFDIALSILSKIN